ncbi:MAG: formate dehydrogenase accessory sulfurtransferase FdhD [Muriicola sp.]
MATRNYQGEKFDVQGVDPVVDALTVEEALQININGKPFTMSMRTPGADNDLIRGLLHSEAIITSTQFHPTPILQKENEEGIVTVVDLEIPEAYLGIGYSNSRSLLSVSSCGICGKTELGEKAFEGKAIEASSQFSAESFTEMFAQMNRGQFDFKQSGGTHAAALFDANGSLLVVKEDIGRHNAVDKAIGWLLLRGRMDEAKAMTVSGRISYEITIKAFKAGIPFLAAVSAPSSLAVDYAKEFGITLLGFCREGRATCYAHPYRINNNRVSSLNPKVS